MGQVQGVFGNCEWPVWPACRVFGKLGKNEGVGSGGEGP